LSTCKTCGVTNRVATKQIVENPFLDTSFDAEPERDSRILVILCTRTGNNKAQVTFALANIHLYKKKCTRSSSGYPVVTDSKDTFQDLKKFNRASRKVSETYI
jgi:hypothetical protein